MLHTDTHTYTGILSGQERRSVTTILAEEGYIEKRFYKEGFADLGVNVHLLLHAFDKKLRVKAPEIYARYLPPYQRMLEHTGLQIIDSEVEVEEPILGFSGQLDKVGFLPGKGYGILDVKVSSCGYINWHEYQSEMYRQALRWHPVYKTLDIQWKAGVIMTPECLIPKLIPHNRIPNIEKICQAIAIINADKHRHKIRMEQINQEQGWW